MNRGDEDRMLRRWRPQLIVERVRTYLTPARRARIEEVLGGRMRGVEVALEAPSDPHNAAAVVRTAEALGAMHVHVVAAEGRALHAKRTTQGAYHWVETHHHGGLSELLVDVERKGMTLCGAAMDGAVSLDQIPIDRPVCLLFGNENRGLSEAARRRCGLTFRVPMFGMSESLNLSVTAAISLHDVLRRRRSIEGLSDLDDAARDRLRARYYLRSVDPRLAIGLLDRKTPS